MKSTLLKSTFFILFFSLIILSCGKEESEVNLTETYFRMVENPCSELINILGSGNPNAKLYNAYSKAGIIRVQSGTKSSSKFNTLTAMGEPLGTDIKFEDLLEDKTTKSLFTHCNNCDELYALDGLSKTKTLLFKDDWLITADKLIINNNILYKLDIAWSGRKIELSSYDLNTSEESPILSKIREDGRWYTQDFNIGIIGNDIILFYNIVDQLQNPNTQELNAYSLNENRNLWSTEIGTDSYTNQEFHDGNQLVLWTYQTVRMFDLEDGQLINQYEIDDYRVKFIEENFLVLSYRDEIRIVNLIDGMDVFETTGTAINLYGGKLYTISNKRQMIAYDVSTGETELCINLKTNKESRRYDDWKISPRNKFIVGAASTCPEASVLVLKYE